MEAVLLFFIFALLCLLFFGIKNISLRVSILKAYLCTFFVVFLGTEILSALHAIRFRWVIVYWVIVFVLLLALFYILSKRYGVAFKFTDSIFSFLDGLSAIGVVGLGFLCALGTITLITAVLTPPNNFDSLTYHMARVAEWIQHQNVQFYPTAIPRQNHAMPLAEFVILHLQILSRSDRFANLVQWGSFLVAIAAVSVIVRELRGTQSAQLVSGLLTAMLPMAILQSSSTQNDLVVGGLCLAFCYFLLQVSKRRRWSDVCFSSLALGLALLTKGTAYIYCAGIGLGIGVVNLFRRPGKEKGALLVRYLIIASGGLVINLGHYTRNFNLYGNPLFTDVGRITVEKLSVAYTIENFIRNIALHISTPFASVNQGVYDIVQAMLGTHLNRPGSTFPGTSFDVRYIISEDFMGNMLHLLVIFFAFILLVVRKGTRKRAAPLVGAVLLSGLFWNGLIKWQPWGSRLHLPWFLLAMPLVGLAVQHLRKHSTVILPLMLICVFISSIPALFLSRSKPWVPIFKQSSRFYQAGEIRRYFSNRPKRFERYKELLLPFYRENSILHTDREVLYFIDRPRSFTGYDKALDQVKKLSPERVGLFLDENDWEYPLWVLSGKHAESKAPEFVHVNVQNVSSRLERDGQDLPRVILTPYFFRRYQIQGQEYAVIYYSQSMIVLEKRGAQSSQALNGPSSGFSP